MALKTIEEEWAGFSAMILPKGCSETQRVEMRKAFYAGAMSILWGCREVGEPHIPEATGEAWFAARQQECDEFYRLMMVDFARRN